MVSQGGLSTPARRASGETERASELLWPLLISERWKHSMRHRQKHASRVSSWETRPVVRAAPYPHLQSSCLYAGNAQASPRQRWPVSHGGECARSALPATVRTTRPDLAGVPGESSDRAACTHDARDHQTPERHARYVSDSMQPEGIKTDVRHSRAVIISTMIWKPRRPGWPLKDRKPQHLWPFSGGPHERIVPHLHRT